MSVVLKERPGVELDHQLEALNRDPVDERVLADANRWLAAIPRAAIGELGADAPDLQPRFPADGQAVDFCASPRHRRERLLQRALMSDLDKRGLVLEAALSQRAGRFHLEELAELSSFQL